MCITRLVGFQACLKSPRNLSQSTTMQNKKYTSKWAPHDNMLGDVCSATRTSNWLASIGSRVRSCAESSHSGIMIHATQYSPSCFISKSVSTNDSQLPIYQQSRTFDSWLQVPVPVHIGAPTGAPSSSDKDFVKVVSERSHKPLHSAFVVVLWHQASVPIN